MNVGKKNIKRVEKSTRVNARSSRKSSKGKLLSGVQTKAARKSSRFYFRSRKPSFATISDFQRTVILSLDASRGKLREITEGSEVIPYVQKIRAKIPRKKCERESVYAILKFKMESGKFHFRTLMVSKNHPRVAVTNNKAIIEKINDALKEGASRTKTYEKAYLTTVTVKRFYQNGK